MAKARVGIWLIGAAGGVATTTVLGLEALKKGLIGTTGLVSSLPELRHLPLVDWTEMIVGGHEIRQVALIDELRRFNTENRISRDDLITQVAGELEAVERRIRTGTIVNVGRTITSLAGRHVPRVEPPREAVERLQADLEDFARGNELKHVVVVNVASTEPPMNVAGIPPTWDELQERLDEIPLPASSLYAIAAMQSGCSYVNFTPSLGSTPAALDELARRCGTRHMGRDGKTGETFMKSVLAPAFARRNLQVMSWVGHNIFGNMDSRVLDDPANKQTKVVSKDHLLHEILGYQPQTHVSIEYIESLHDWKTAWDHIHFTGFLGVPMTLQFTWQGCDSVLAAPLVLDLVRLTDVAHQRGQTGALQFLAAFFKSPLGVDQHCFELQSQMLQQWAEGSADNG